MAASITAKTPFATTAVDTNAKLQINTIQNRVVFTLDIFTNGTDLGIILSLMPTLRLDLMNNKIKQAGAELCQAHAKLC